MNLGEGVAAARAALKHRGLRPAVAGHDIWIASGLEVALPETVLLCLQHSPAVDVLRGRDIEVFCLSEVAGPAEVAGKSTLDLFLHPKTREFCGRAGRLAVMAFKPSERLASAVAHAGGELLHGSLRAARAAENKLAFIDLAQRAGVPTPAWRAVSAGARYEEVTAELGELLVVQAARGNAGLRTHLVRSPAEWDAATQHLRSSFRIATYAAGTPFTATGVTGDATPLVAEIEPCRQLTGIDWLTPSPLGSCGNVWGDAEIEAVAPDASSAMAKMGAQLQEAGYRGVFGVDFVNSDAGPVVIETNPRMVASLPLATQLETAADRAPLLLQALTQLLGPGGRSANGGFDRILQPASQVIAHSLSADDADATLGGGVYRLHPGEPPEYLREGCWLSDLGADDEALVLTRSAGEARSPGREFARIYFRGSQGEHHPGIREAVMALRGA